MLRRSLMRLSTITLLAFMLPGVGSTASALAPDWICHIRNCAVTP